MSTSSSWFLAFVCLVLLLSARAQQPDRVTVRPELTTSVRLAGHLPSWATPEADAGAVPPDVPLRLTFVLSRTPEQQAAFTQLLADEQDATSSRYRQWLTPQQVGELYGPTQHDIDAFTAWLGTRGLPNAEIAPSHMFVTVDGTASTVSAALSTSFRYFTLQNDAHLSTTQDPALPATFAAIVQSIAGLSDIPTTPTSYGEAVSISPTRGSGAQPRFNSSSGTHYIGPDDFTAMFHFNNPYSANVTGIGQRVAVIGRSRVVATDISEFQSLFNLPANPPNTIVPGAGPDPGLAGGGDQLEATLDVSRVVATAPTAQIDLVILPNSGGGIYSAAQYAVNTLNDPIMNISFSGCELHAGLAGVQAWDTLFSQAASQGISVFVSSGDSGVATCDIAFTAPPAVQSASINYICASSYATCVGGTELNDFANPSAYWSANNGTNFLSVRSYIPEGAWNEPSSGTGFVAASGGGGASIYVAKPSWQTGLGVPADGARDVPDVSYPAAGHNPYVACYAANNGDCANNRFEGFAGTSTAAPTMAALVAMVDQQTGVRQGNFNPTLYHLGATPSNNVFHDTTVATSGVVSCTASIPSLCNNSTPSATSLTGGVAGAVLTPGYDLATGLGSIDATYLMNALATPRVNPAFGLGATSQSIFTGNTVTFTATIANTSGKTPTGFVQLFQGADLLGNALAVPSSGKVVFPAIPFAVAGAFNIKAIYSGDANFFAVPTSPLNLTVSNPGFSIAASPGSLSFTAGATTGNTATLTYTSLGAFSGSIAQSCTITFGGGFPPLDPPTCSYTASSVSLPSGGTATGTITISTTAVGASLARGPESQSRNRSTALCGMGLGALIFLLLPPARRSRIRHWSSFALTVLIATGMFSLSGCGKSSSAAGAAAPGSSPGLYVIALTSLSGTTAATPAASISVTVH
ncbi:MAG TPA: protease pro-enzyme activation domain-containing protein [Acidobacteriaceae bacterium]